MKRSVLIASILTSGLGLTACQTTPKINTTTNPAKAVTMPLTDSKLQNYDWQLVSVTNSAGNNAQEKLFTYGKPLVVTFDKAGKVTFKNTCNHLWGNYMLTNDNVIVGDIASTRMMCDPAGMAFDSLAPTTLQGQFKLTEDGQGHPVLTVTGPNQISVFKPVAK